MEELTTKAVFEISSNLFLATNKYDSPVTASK